jgi:uncharacterized protein
MSALLRPMERVERVEFMVAGDRVVGDLHLPAGNMRSPAVVVLGPMTSVKEQSAGVYARALALRGIAALACDPRHFGESGGQPRQYEHPPHKIEDAVAAVGYLRQRREIDADRIGLVGICIGAGYALHASLQLPQLWGIGAVAGYYRDAGAIRAQDATGYAARVTAGVAARRHFDATGEVYTIPAAAAQGEAAMVGARIARYYEKPLAAGRVFVNAYAVMSSESYVPFDVLSTASRIEAPVVMVHSENCIAPTFARKFQFMLNAPHESHWLPAGHQTDFYDEPDRVAAATDLVATGLLRLAAYG